MNIKHKRKTDPEKPPVFVLARYEMDSFPRHLRGKVSKYLWWSKPRITLYEVKTAGMDQPVSFDDKQMQIVEYADNKVTITVENKNGNSGEEESERRTVPVNTPLITGENQHLFDASEELYFGCWTSEKNWERYYWKVLWDRKIDNWACKLRTLPTYFTFWSIRRACRLWYLKLRMRLDNRKHIR